MIDYLRRILNAPLPRIVAPPRRLWPALIVAYACLVPKELSFEIGGAALFPYRLALIATAPAVIVLMVQERIRPSIVDLFAGFTAIWFFIALLNAATTGLAFTRGIALALDFGLAYLVGRTCVRTSNDVRLIFLYLLPALVAVAAIMAAESFSRQFILRPALAAITGFTLPNPVNEIRLGLGRAAGPFPHPILAGVFMASTIPLALLVQKDLRLKLVAVITGLAAVFALSAAAFLALAVALALVALYVAQRRLKLPVFPVAGLYGMLLILFIQAGSQSGAVSFLLRNLTLNPASGSYRLMIWHFGWADAKRHPWFGIGDGDWLRPVWMPNPSVDAYWLVLPLYYGMPAMIGAGLTLAGALFVLLRTQKYRNDYAHSVGGALGVMIIIFAFSGFTVHLWENLQAWMLLTCGMAVGLASQTRAAVYAAAPTAPPRSLRDWRRSPDRLIAPYRKARRS